MSRFLTLNLRGICVIFAVLCLAALVLNSQSVSRLLDATVYASASDREIANGLNIQPVRQTINEQKGVRPFVGAVNGEAFVLSEGPEGVQTTKIITSLPVFKAFGLTSDGRRLLYSPLRNGSPSGELVFEDLDSSKRTKVTTKLVLEAA
ncbi:MAG: hypothetical protein ACT4O9_11775, partial [Blastocatellia bacterium]